MTELPDDKYRRRAERSVYVFLITLGVLIVGLSFLEALALLEEISREPSVIAVEIAL